MANERKSAVEALLAKNKQTTGSTGQSTSSGGSAVDQLLRNRATQGSYYAHHNIGTGSATQPLARPKTIAEQKKDYADTIASVENARVSRSQARQDYADILIRRDNMRSQAEDLQADYDRRIASGERQEDLADQYAQILARLDKAKEYDRQVDEAYKALQNSRANTAAASANARDAHAALAAMGAKYGENAAKSAAAGTPLAGAYNNAPGRISTLNDGEYADIMQRSDYASKSQAGESKNTWSGKYDTTYDYINDINGQRGITKLNALQGRGGGDYGKYDFLTKDEIGVYNYLYATEGKKSAEKYLKSLDIDLNAQYQGWLNNVEADVADNNAATKALFSAGTAIVAPARGLAGAAATAQDIYRTATGQEIDPNSSLRRLSQNTQAIREGVSKDMSPVGSFFYNAGMSAADSAVNALTMQGAAQALGFSGDALLKATNILTSAAMSSEVASMSIAESKNKGYSDVGALSLGLIRGGIEYMTEKIGGEFVIKAIKKNPASFLNSMIRAMVPEGIEENMSDIGNEAVNIFSDLVFNTEESFISNAYNVHKANGSKNPWLETAKDVATQEFLSFAAGSLSAFGNAAVQYKGNAATINSAAKALNTTSDEVVKIMNDYNIENPYAVEILADLHDADSAKSFREAMDAYENAQEAIDEAMRISGMNTAQTNKLLRQAGVGSVSNQTESAWDVLTGKTTPEESRATSEKALKDLGFTRKQTRAAIDSNRYESPNVITTREMGRVYDDAQKKLAAEGVTDERLAGAISAVALQQISEAQDTAGGIEPTKFQQKLVKDNEMAQRLVAELVAESNQRVSDVSVNEEDLKNAKYDGNNVDIVGFDNGKVKIRTADGNEQTVPLERMEVSYGYSTLLEAAAGRENGVEMLRAYKPGQNVDAFVNAWNTAEKLIGAATNYTMEQARETWPDAFRVLSDSQLIRAIESGRQLQAESKKEAAKESEQYKALREEAEQMEKEGKVERKAGTVTFEKLNEKKLNKKQQKVANMVKAVADVLSFDFVLYEGDKNTGGVYIQGGKIYVNINSGNYAGKYIGAATLAHEITHALAEYDKQSYLEFRDFITNEVLTPAELAKLVDRQLALEPNLDPDAALDEAIANGCAKMLLNNDAIQKLAEQNRSLFGWIADKVNEITGRINDAYDEIDLSDDISVYEAARIFQRAENEIRERWNKMLVTANENKQAEQMTGKKISANKGGVQQMAIDKDKNVIVDGDVKADDVYSLLEDLESGKIKNTDFSFAIWKHTPQVYIDHAEYGDRSFVMNASKAKDAILPGDGHRHGLGAKGLMRVILNLYRPDYIIEEHGDNEGHHAAIFMNDNGDVVAAADLRNWRTGTGAIAGEEGFYNTLLTAYDELLPWMKKKYKNFDEYVNGLFKSPNRVVYDKSEDGEYEAPEDVALSEPLLRLLSGTSSAMSIADIPIKSNTEIDAGDTAFEFDKDTESVNIQHQLLTWEASDYVTERNKAAKEIADKLGISQKKAKDYIDSVNSVAKYIAENKGRLDYEDTGRSPFVSNVEYGGSFDFTTLCKKRRLLTGTFSAIQNALKNTALTANEILEIRKMMDDAGLEVSCGKCYVEGSRASMGIFTKEFLKLYEKYNPGAWVPNMAQMNTPDGIEWVRVNHPEVYEQYEYFWNHYGTLRPGDPNLFASQQKPKLYQMRSAYKGEVLKHFKNDGSIQEKNRNGGLRMQSFSGFEIVHLLDAMQVIMDMSRVGLNGQAYTKVPDFAWALGKTGLKINLSIDAWDVVDGKLVFNNKEGMNFNEAMRIRDANSKNVGTICCVYDDAQLLAALADPRIDFIIPFHRSQWKKSQYKGMGLPATTKDYTYQQNEKWLNPSAHTHEYRGRQVKDKCTNYMPNEYWDFSKSGKENAEEYLRMCARDGKRPKFYKFLTNNGDGSYSLKSDGSTDGYWKLLIDFKMYDNEGNGSPQMPVKPDFNMKEIRRMLESYEGGHNSFPVAHGVVNQFVDKYKAAHPGQQFQKLGDETKVNRDNLGYHAGDLGKAEHLNIQGRSRGTGHFGTGTYFVGVEEKVTKDSHYGKRPQHAVDFSDYNLYKVRNDRDGYRLHDALKIIDGGINKEWISPAIQNQFNIVNPTGYYDLARSKYGEDWASGDNLLNSILDYAKENGIDVKSLEEYKAEEGKGIDDADLKYYYEDYVKDTVKEKISDINAEYRELMDAVFELHLLPGFTNAKIFSALQAVAEYQDVTPRNARTDSYATVFMKNMGYDGVDVRNTGLDNTAYGSVIYDVKPETVAYQKLWNFSNKAEIDAEIDRVQDQIRDIQNAQWRARDNVKADPRVKEAQEKLWAAEDAKGRAGALPERREYNRIYKEVKDELNADIPEGDLNELADRVAELKELREQFINVTPITRRQYDELADHFGTTDDYAVAGFILPDGRMLDFSGKKQYGRQYAGGREVYHNEVGDVLDLKTDTSPRIEMVSNGNIRLVPEVNGINLSQKPTAQQKEALRGFIEYHNGDIHVDIDNVAGRTLESFGYYNGASTSKILADIDNYFKTGEAPKPQSIYRPFYQKLGIGETAEEQEARKESFDNLKAENKILRARAEYWKAQTRTTKERTVRQQDTDRLARELLKKYESRADRDEVKAAMKALGDWLVQTDELDYDELYARAEAIAEDIISGNYALLDNSQQENLDRLKDYLKNTPVNLSKADFRDTGDEGFRKKYGRYFTVSERGRTIDSLWGEMAAMFGEGVFPEDVYAPGDMLNMIADYLDMWKPQYGNEFELFHDEAVNAATNEIIDAILSEDVRQTPATYADKAQQKLNSQIAKDRERLDALREAKNARIEELKRQASEKNAQIRLAEKAAKYEAVSKVKQHYQDMLTRQRNKRGDTKVRAKIKKLHKELSDMLVKPRNGHYVPKELVKATADILGAIDTTTGKSIKASTAFAELKIKYDALKNKPGEDESARQASDRVLLYDEGISEMIQKIAENVGDSRIYDLTGENLENIYTTLKALKHTIVTANKLVGAKIEANAFEAATQMMNETDMAKGIPTKALRRFVMAQMTPSSAFRAFGGYKKNSMWEQMFNELNNGQLTQTQILMEGGQIFRELIDDKKNMAKLHDQKNLVDIGLKDSQGNAIKVTRGMMLSVYMHLLNEQNAKHVAYGGLKVPRLKQYYKNEIKEAYSLDATKTATNAEAIAELNDQLKEAQSVEEQDAIKEKLAELNDKTEAFMNNLRSEIEKQLTDYDRKWVAAAQTFFDEYSKNKLNEVTEMIYGFEKAQVDHYFPIHTDPNFRAASFDTIVRDFSLENAGFMKERVNSATPILLEDITDVISSQLRRTAQYVGLMPAIRNFNKVYGKARAGYANSVQEAMSTKFGDQGMKYVENLMADLNGARKTEANIFDELRGNMAGAVLTLNPRVAMAQAASYPTAASEIGYKPLIKALKDIKNNPNWNEVAREEVAKWTPLWWYRMQGFSTVELGDIKNNEQALSKVLQKMKWATGWIQFMDGATTGALWQASKYYVDENFTDLKKGSDEYMMKVAEVYNRVLEKTQPDYTTMQRPDILRNPNAIVKQLTMFMTQRLQNTNILYDAAATYSHYVRDADAGRNGVTAADVKQARTRLVWAVSSQVAAGATIVIFKAIADALMHNLKAYRDDDDELTAESISKTMLTNFAETLTSNVLWGSELFAALKSVVTGDRYYGISLNGVDTFKDILEDGVKTLSKAWKGDWEGFKAPAWKLSKAVAQFFGIPLGNAEKVGKMTANWFEDARNGTWYEAGVDRTRAQNTHLLFTALQSGDGEKAERIRAEFKDEKDARSALKGYIQELYTGKDQKIQKAETVKLLQQYAGMTKREAEDTAQKWTMEVVTGYKFSSLQDDYISGEIPKAKAVKFYQTYSSNGKTTQAEAEAKILEWTCEKDTGIAYSDIGNEVKTGRLSKDKAIQMVMKYGGKDEDAATKTVNGYLIEHEYDIKPSEMEDEYMAGRVDDDEAMDILLRHRYYGKEEAEKKATEELERMRFVKANPDAEDISVTQVRNYQAAGLEGIVSASVYADAAKMMGTFHGVDADDDGKTDRYSIIIQKLEYIDTLDLTPEQKTRLAQALGISDKNIRRRAPWR